METGNVGWLITRLIWLATPDSVEQSRNREQTSHQAASSKHTGFIFRTEQNLTWCLVALQPDHLLRSFDVVDIRVARWVGCHHVTRLTTNKIHRRRNSFLCKRQKLHFSSTTKAPTLKNSQKCWPTDRPLPWKCWAAVTCCRDSTIWRCRPLSRTRAAFCCCVSTSPTPRPCAPPTCRTTHWDLKEKYTTSSCIFCASHSRPQMPTNDEHTREYPLYNKTRNQRARGDTDVTRFAGRNQPCVWKGAALTRSFTHRRSRMGRCCCWGCSSSGWRRRDHRCSSVRPSRRRRGRVRARRVRGTCTPAPRPATPSCKQRPVMRRHSYRIQHDFCGDIGTVDARSSPQFTRFRSTFGEVLAERGHDDDLWVLFSLCLQNHLHSLFCRDSFLKIP